MWAAWIGILALHQASVAVAAPTSPTADTGWIDEAPAPPTVRRAGIGVPRAAGSLRLGSVHTYDTKGLDTVAQYASADEAISGSAFVYYPSLADTGLTFLATDATIRRRFGPGTRIAEDRLVAVGGVAEAGRRVIYAGGSDGLRSTAATFIRAGGWIIVLRVRRAGRPRSPPIWTPLAPAWRSAATIRSRPMSSRRTIARLSATPMRRC
jgi:hypothetical protein